VCNPPAPWPWKTLNPARPEVLVEGTREVLVEGFKGLGAAMMFPLGLYRVERERERERSEQGAGMVCA
jgi:hypothetical protein